MTRSAPVTRTVAIIKNHALQHRFDIEPRIQEASFEIVKERQVEFDVETDPDALHDLFGEDAGSLGEGPVWVYVLERRRAVEVWHTLMGNRDPEIARVETPHSLRALYGISLAQNALMGSPDMHTAELQISALFVSSPLFPSTDLPSESDGDRYNNSIRSPSSSVLESLQTGESHGTYPSSSAVGVSLSHAKSSPRARAEPDIAPRMTRTTALRITGAVHDKSPSKPRTPISKERHAQTFANVPGHKRDEIIPVPSTAPPLIVPRMSKAASLRIAKDTGSRGGPVTPPMKKRSITNGSATSAGSAEKATNTFEGIPGHKRRETFNVASVRSPTVTPKLNKSAALRQMQREGRAALSTAFQTSSPALSRTTSTDLGASRRQLVPTKTPSLQTPSRPPPSRRALSALDMCNPKDRDESSRSPSTMGKLQQRPGRVVPPPTITPRTNRSAALRTAKMEAQAQSTVAKNVPRASRSSLPGLKAIAT
ncbi:hypothetical protein Ac2012v2_001098 [Leucoagaricus gongylophorus]